MAPTWHRLVAEERRIRGSHARRPVIHSLPCAGVQTTHALESHAAHLGWKRIAREIYTLEALSWRRRRVRPLGGVLDEDVEAPQNGQTRRSVHLASSVTCVRA